MTEIAIPIVALGAFYILSNQDKNNNNKTNCHKDNRENFSNINPGPIENQNMNQNVKSGSNNMNNNFNQVNSGTNNARPHTDKFFDTNNYLKINQQQTDGIGVGNNYNNDIMSLTGNTIDKQNFKHNNMVPFFGSKTRGATADSNLAEAILDNKQGTGSQHFKKQETGPLFVPEEQMNWQHGVPNNSDFIQSRMNLPNKMNNVTLWDQQQVGPGLNLGYTTEGSGGLNAGLEGRETHLPRTVNELRMEGNPKTNLQYNNPQGPAMNKIQNLGIHGKIEKHLPDKFYESGPERWFTTTGLEKRETSRSENILKNENREDTSLEYYGSGRTNSGQATYVDGEYEDSKRQQLGSLSIKNPSLKGQNKANANDYCINSYDNLPNNRSTTQHQLEMGGVQGVVKALMAPLNDILRPTRKENVVGNLRENGNVQADSLGNYVVNPNSKTKTTIREMTGDRMGMNYLNIQKQHADGYMSNKQTPIANQRDTTSSSYVGGGNSQISAMKNNNIKHFGVDNPNKSYEARINQGGTQMFNSNVNIDINKNDSDRNNNRLWVPTNAPANVPSQEFRGNQQSVPVSYPNQCNDRLDPSLLNAFKNNPYTQSLQSWA